MNNLLGGNDFWTVIGRPLRDWLVSNWGFPEWLVAILYAVFGAVNMLGAITVLVMMALWAERRFIARLQDRRGPNRVGKFGLLQSPADVLKLLSKEIIFPRRADKFLHFLAPLLVLSPSLMVWAVIPWGPGLQVTDLNAAVLYLLAFASMPIIGITLAGWGSYNKYSLLGGMRAVVQFMSYEVPGAIVLAVPVLLAGTLSLQGIVQAQSGFMWNWFVMAPAIPIIEPFKLPIPIIGVIAFVWFIIAGLAEVNRTPFDHVEAESELGAGFHTEYSGMQFALFMLAEYANAISFCLLASALFLGGYHTGLGQWFDDLIWPFLPGVLVTKAALLFMLFVWIRGTLPRFRYDQLMQFAWKRMLPVAVLLVVATTIVAPFVGVQPPAVAAP